MKKYAIRTREEKKEIAKTSIKYFTKLAEAYRAAGLIDDAKRYEAEAQEFIKDFPELA